VTSVAGLKSRIFQSIGSSCSVCLLMIGAFELSIMEKKFSAGAQGEDGDAGALFVIGKYTAQRQHQVSIF
jgi:hypothetical protein